MEQYISKDAVVAEIKKMLDKHTKLQLFNYGAVKDLESLLNFLNTLVMSKTFGQLKAGDEVYVINGCNVDIVKVSVAEPSPTEKHYTWVVFDDNEYSVHSDLTSIYDDMVGDIYCDINEAMRKMQEICAKALRDYKCAIGSLNLLETKQNKK